MLTRAGDRFARRAKTQAVRDIEAGRIKSIIEPKLADHVRREALKFLTS
jgi:hypothetical protein